ncbi:MAG TPA: hypothetical protein VI874_02745, partial [Candidatus Norongarragalinales archaeon]|nr:hypothetical protein [Candidatus Norongarragalinales archaeon]
EGKSPNKHNKFKMFVEPLEESVLAAIREGKVDPTKKGKELMESLLEAGLPREEARNVMKMHEENLFLDMTKGVQYLQDIRELLLEAFKDAMTQGPMAKEKVIGVKVKLTDASIHVDPAHRGPAQIIPAVRRPIYASMLQADPVLMEPKQKLFVNVPSEYMSGVINLIQGRRGQILDMQQEGEAMNISSKVPVANMFGFASDIRGVSQGRAAWYYEYAGYERLPSGLQGQTITQIRKRKGEPETPPTARDFMD